MQLEVDVTANTVLDDYMICKGDDFGRALLLCDVDDTLAFYTQQKLISLLSDLQEKVKCDCDSGCQRPDGNDRFFISACFNFQIIFHWEKIYQKKW